MSSAITKGFFSFLTRRVLFFFCSLILLILLIPFSSRAADFRRLEVGQPLPDFTLSDLEEKPFTLNDLKGHNSLLLFWNIPEGEVHRDYSLEELLMVQNLFTWYGTEKGFIVVAIYVPRRDDKVNNEEIEEILLRQEKYKLDVPIVIDRGLKLFNQYGVKATPSTLMLDEEGKITFTMSSYPWSAEKLLKKTVESQLKVMTSQAKYAKVVPDKSAQESLKKTPRRMSPAVWDNGSFVVFDRYQGDKLLDNPTDVTINSRGQLFIVDTGNAQVHMFLSNGQYETSLGKKGFGGGKLVLPWGICVDDSDRIYVSDIGQHMIHIFDNYKRFLAVIGRKGEGMGSFNMPFDIDYYDERLFIADTGNDIIQVIRAKFERQFGKWGRRETEFANPTALAVGGGGKIYVVDTDNNRIQIFTDRGKFLRKFGASGSGRGEFSRPLGIALDRRGRIYVSDSGNNRLQIFDSEGKFLIMYGESGKKPNQFKMPGKIFVDTDDNVFVVDTGNNRVVGLNSRLFRY